MFSQSRGLRKQCFETLEKLNCRTVDCSANRFSRFGRLPQTDIHTQICSSLTTSICFRRGLTLQLFIDKIPPYKIKIIIKSSMSICPHYKAIYSLPVCGIYNLSIQCINIINWYLSRSDQVTDTVLLKLRLLI